MVGSPHHLPYFKLYMQPPQLPTLYNINITILKMVKRAGRQEVPVCLVAMGK